jgi:hypothetical protein
VFGCVVVWVCVCVFVLSSVRLFAITFFVA